MTPLPSTAIPPGVDTITPKPVATRPGSMPSTRGAPAPTGSIPSTREVALAAGSIPRTRDGASGSRSRDGLQDFVGNVVVRMHGLDVVQLLEGLDQFHDGVRLLAL